MDLLKIKLPCELKDFPQAKSFFNKDNHNITHQITIDDVSYWIRYKKVRDIFNKTYNDMDLFQIVFLQPSEIKTITKTIEKMDSEDVSSAKEFLKRKEEIIKVKTIEKAKKKATRRKKLQSDKI